MFHNQSGERYWRRLYDEHADFQLALLNGDELAADLHSLPIAWDGTDEDLPAGWDESFERAFESGREPTALSAVAITVSPARRDQRLSGRMIEAMRDAARAHGLGALLAPVRPTLKARYLLIPIEEFVRWRRPDGSHLDLWIRTHERVGGEILRPAPESMVIEAPVADWEEWTGLQLPGDGATSSRGCSPCSRCTAASAVTWSRTSGCGTPSRPGCVASARRSDRHPAPRFLSKRLMRLQPALRRATMRKRRAIRSHLSLQSDEARREGRTMLLNDSDSRLQLAREHAGRLAEEMRRSRRLMPDMAGLSSRASAHLRGPRVRRDVNVPAPRRMGRQGGRRPRRLSFL